MGYSRRQLFANAVPNRLKRVLLLLLTPACVYWCDLDNKRRDDDGEICAILRSLILTRVLHLAVAERPVFPGVVDEIDPDVFFPYAGPLVDLIGYPLIEFFLHLNGPTAKST